MRDTNTVFLEVMRKDDLAKLNHYADVALKKFEDVAGRGTKDWQGLQRKEQRFFRLSNKAASLELKKKAEEKAAAAAKWKGRAKVGAGVAAGAGLAYGAYRWNKNRQQKQKAKESTSQYFARMLREAETRINADHIALGLNVLKATGFDQAMARQMGDDKQRSQAWKYGLRGAALGVSVPALEYGIKTAYELGMHALDARRNGVRGVGDILRYARDHRFGAFGYPSATMQAAHELGRAYTSNPALLGKVSAGLAGAGALYGLMKKAPDGKKPTPTLMKPKKQYKYIRKDGDKYVYPKKIGVKK